MRPCLSRPLQGHPELAVVAYPSTAARGRHLDSGAPAASDCQGDTAGGAAAAQLDEPPTGIAEYRVHAHHYTNTGRHVRSDGWTLLDALCLVLASATAYMCPHEWVALVMIFIWGYLKCNTVIHESVTAFPSLGLQLSTTRGLSFPLLAARSTASSRHASPPRTLVPLRTRRRFIPLSAIQAVVINEGLTRWRVGYYLAVILKDDTIVVAYPTIRPRAAVLKEVYHGVRHALRMEPRTAPRNEL